MELISGRIPFWRHLGWHTMHYRYVLSEENCQYYVDLATRKSRAPRSGCLKPENFYEFCNFVLRFSVSIVGLLFWVWIISKQKQWKKNCMKGKFVLQLNFNPGLGWNCFWTTQAWFQLGMSPQSNRKQLLDQQPTMEKHVTSMSSKPEPTILPHDTGQ